MLKYILKKCLGMKVGIFFTTSFAFDYNEKKIIKRFFPKKKIPQDI